MVYGKIASPQIKFLNLPFSPQFHPDRNKAPGAGEAFKAIGNAYAVLSNPETKKKYDFFGQDHMKKSECCQKKAEERFFSGAMDPTRGFQGGASPQVITTLKTTINDARHKVALDLTISRYLFM